MKIAHERKNIFWSSEERPLLLNCTKRLPIWNIWADFTSESLLWRDQKQIFSQTFWQKSIQGFLCSNNKQTPELNQDRQKTIKVFFLKKNIKPTRAIKNAEFLIQIFAILDENYYFFPLKRSSLEEEEEFLKIIRAETMKNYVTVNYLFK